MFNLIGHKTTSLNLKHEYISWDVLIKYSTVWWMPQNPDVTWQFILVLFACWQQTTPGAPCSAVLQR